MKIPLAFALPKEYNINILCIGDFNMMNDLLFSANVVMPIFLLIMLGYALTRLKLWNDGFLKIANDICFKVLLPVLLFYNVANANIFEVFRGKLILYVEEFTLLKKTDLQQHECVVGAKDLELISKFDESDETVVTLTMKCPLYPEGISMIMKNDFHYREFVEAASTLS